jgi:LemA protein
MGFIYIIIAILAVLVFWAVLSYNRLIILKNRTKEAWSDIDVQLKRRYDLIPNLVETVKGYAGHEKELFVKLAEARSGAMKATGVKEKAEAENVLASTLKTLFAVTENYPQLRAADNFLALQSELSDTENKIQAARRFYNSNVMELNTRIEIFPASLIASTFNFQKMDFFEIAEPSQKEPVQVKF